MTNKQKRSMLYWWLPTKCAAAQEIERNPRHVSDNMHSLRASRGQWKVRCIQARLQGGGEEEEDKSIMQ